MKADLGHSKVFLIQRCPAVVGRQLVYAVTVVSLSCFC